MRLRNRIALNVIVMVVLTGITLGAISLNQLREEIRQEDRDWSLAVAKAVAKAVTRPTLSKDRVTVREVLESVLKSNSELAYLLVSDFDGVIFTSTFDEVPAPLNKDHSDCAHGIIRNITINGRAVRDISHPLVDGLDAHLHIGIDRKHAEASLANITGDTLISVILITIVGALLAVFVSQRISQPLNQLTTALRRYGQGKELDDVEGGHSKVQEIRELYSSFSNMVDERARTERLLNERNAQLLSVAGASSLVLFSLDHEGRFTLSEGAALEQLGLSPGEVVGLSVFDVYADHPEVVDAARTVLDHGIKQWTRTEINGRIFETQWSPLLDERKQIIGAIGVSVDKTEWEQAETELEQFKSTLDQTLDCVFMFNPNDLRFFYCNEGAIDQVGYSREELMTMTPVDIKPDYDEAKFRRLAQPLIDGDRHSLTVRTRHRHKDGHDMPVEIFLQYIHSGGTPRFVAIVRDISEQVAIEGRLRRSEEMLLEAQEIAHVGSWRLDLATGKAEWSDEEYRILGYEPGSVEASVDNFIKAVHVDDRDMVKKAIEQATDPHRPTPYHTQYRLQTPAGIRIVEENGRVLFGADNKATTLYGTTLDITKRVLAEQESQRLVSILEATTDMVGIADTEGRTLYLNQAGRALCGFGDTPVEELHISDYHPPQVTERILKEALPYAAEHGAWSGETALLDREGHVIPVSQVLLSHKDEQGNVLYFSTIVRDISDRLRNEQQLKELNDKLEKMVQERTATIKEQSTILDQIHDSVITTDMEGIITGWNKGAERLLGYTAIETLGKHISLIYPQDQHKYLAENVIKPLQEKGDHEVEVIMQRKNGECFDGHVSLSLLHDKNGKAVGMVGYSLDISDRKRAEHNLRVAMEQAEEASRSKSDFLSRMSHELRTPMNAILGFSQLLEQNIDQNLSHEDLDYVSEVIHAGRHLLELINEVLDLSRIESGRIQFSMETLDLDELVDECISLLRPMADATRITIQKSRPQEQPLVDADRVRLKQVILNLMSNALKYNHEGGRIELSYEKRDGNWRFSISDTGPGIPEAMQHRVFEPFDRLGADTSNVEGTGIGLSLSKRLVENMGGKLSFDSREGEGTTFWFEIAQGRRQVEKQHEFEALEEPSVPASKYKLLYVEDNPANLRLVGRLLKHRGGIELYDAHTASLAMDLIRTNRFDLILLDIHLAGNEDGYDILNKLRADPITRDIPVIAVSANATEHDIELGLAAGFSEYMTKPIDVDIFFKLLNKYLKD